MKAYDPKKTKLDINFMTVTGYADGTKIETEPLDEDLVKVHVGVDGDACLTEVHNDVHMLTVRLKQNSPWNAIFDGYAKMRERFVIMLNNKQGGKYIGGGSHGRVAKRIKIGFAGEQTNREWKLVVVDYSGINMPE